MVRLPVSGASFDLRPPAGEDDVLLLETAADDTQAAQRLLERLALPVGPAPAIADLTITDLQTLLLRLHEILFGPNIVTTAACRREGCGTPLDVSFGIGSFLAHHAPRPSGTPAARSGWWRVPGTEVEYRPPSIADLAHARLAPAPEAALRRRCLEPPDMAPPLRRRAERAMARQAPDMSGTLSATCPACGADTTLLFDVVHFVIRTLRAHAAFVFEDAHLLALNYHWPEATILAMPRARRIRYAEMLRGAA